MKLQNPNYGESSGSQSLAEGQDLDIYIKVLLLSSLCIEIQLEESLTAITAMEREP